MGDKKTYTDSYVEKMADEMEKFFTKNKNAVTLSEFFIEEKGLHSNIPKRFSEQNQYFKAKLENVKEILKSRLIKGGLGMKVGSQGKGYSSNFARFVLEANYNMVPVQKIEQETKLEVKGSLADLFKEVDKEKDKDD
jgi:hypothetical protein